MVNKYINYENEGRKKLETAYKKYDWLYANYRYSPYDAAFINIDNTLTIAEIKTRNYKSTTYDSTMLELNKLLSIKDINIVDDMEVTKRLYIIHYSDNVTVAFNLDNISTTAGVKTININATTAELSYKRDKQVLFLDYLIACDFRQTDTGKKLKRIN